MYWSITLPEKLLRPFSRWLNRQVFYYENLTAESIDLLTDEQVQDIDQFILRYTKLQDTMGTRLFTSILNYLYEPVDNRPMLDILHRLEKLGLIDSIAMWQEVRLVRNRFAHDYANDPEKNAAQLNIAFESTLDLYNMLNTIRTWFRNAYPTLELGKELPDMPGNWSG